MPRQLQIRPSNSRLTGRQLLVVALTVVLMICTSRSIASRKRPRARIEYPHWVRPCQLSYDIWLAEEAPPVALGSLPERFKAEYQAL